jgi:hypothetical protein
MDRLGSLVMLRHPSCTIALVVMLVGLSPAQAADAIATLTCQGTMTDGDAKPEQISIGVIVNLADRTVQGFGISGYPIKITVWTEVTVEFQGSQKLDPTVLNTWGILDRVNRRPSGDDHTDAGRQNFTLDALRT